MDKKEDGKGRLALVVCVNALLACAIIGAFIVYNTSYQNKLREQNLADITNINNASASIGSAFFQSRQSQLSGIVQYVSSQNFSLDQTLAYIADSTAASDGTYEVVGTDSRGYAAVRSDGGFVPVDYTFSDYASFAKVFTGTETTEKGTILCTQEFTDRISAHKSFALYAHLTLPAQGGNAYTLLAVTQTSAMAALIDLNADYEGMGTVLVNRAGDYVFGSTDFKSENLFQYFYTFNDLTLDQRNALVSDFAADGGGRYYYRDGQGQDCVFVYTSVPGTQWYCVSCVPLASFHYDKIDLRFTLVIAVLLLVLMAFDLVWLWRINGSLKESAYKERQASSAKTDFLSRMSHDIRTPLNVVIGSTALARREDNPPATRAHLENIDQSGRFLLSLVNDILDLNKVESGKMELFTAPYSLRQFCSSIQAIFMPLCREKDIELSVTGGDSDTAYMLDSTRLNQIFFNILSNSVKFTAPGGHIGLDCKAVPTEDGKAILRFTASDDGQGMTEEFQHRMFESFSQEHEGRKSEETGTGLGLAIVKSLVDLMDGAIEVESALGQGTTFHVALPVEVAREVSQQEDGPAIAVPLAGKCVLLFEDNAINAQIAESMLANEGVVVEHASDGEEGLEMFVASEPHHYDAMLMDLRMPVMGGIDATRAIRALPRPDAGRIPIIAMTANAYDTDVRECIAAGMNAHLAKPIDPDLMFSTLARQIAMAEQEGDTPSDETDNG